MLQNLKNSWYHFDPPLIWKELNQLGGKPHYVGGLSEFWEYIYDYYNLQSLLSKHELRKLTAESMQARNGIIKSNMFTPILDISVLRYTKSENRERKVGE